METALLKVHDDVMREIDKKRCVFLILLDLSAAFDTVNHEILLRRLFDNFGVRGLVLDWFRSYLSDRGFFVSVQGGKSSMRASNCGVPQGSILGPILFSLYITPVADIILSHGLKYHLYADDTQLYVSFSHASVMDMEEARRKVQNCVSDLNVWMQRNKLKLNGDKTEVAVLSPEHLSPPSLSSINIAGFEIEPSSSVRNIGVFFDKHLNLDSHISSICRSCLFHIHNKWKILRWISFSVCETLVHALISCRLDFCNSLLFGISKSSLTKLQSVQNAAARLVTLTRKSEHITPILLDLHWLPVEQRIEFKINLLTFKILNGLSPDYLCDLIQPYIPPRSLRSSSANLLTRSSFNLKSYGKHSILP